MIDQLVDDVAYEAKVGRTSLTRTVKRQIAKDGELVETGAINRSEWRFYRSPATGDVGPTSPLKKALTDAGIEFEVFQ